MTYLDDPDHDWSLDTSDSPDTLTDLVRSLGAVPGSPDDPGHDLTALSESTDQVIQIVLQGYHGLKTRHPQATDLACLRTSMVWYFG